MIKCYAPWTNLDVDYDGSMRPCCKFEIQHYQDSTYDLMDGDFEDYVHSPMLEQVKHELLSGQWPAGCKKCKNDEAVSMVSKRQELLNDFSHLNQLVKFTDSSNIVSVTTALGISCNLACITCDHTRSTGWRPETKKIYNIVPASTSYTRSSKRALALTKLPNYQHLELAGGESLTTNFKDHKLLLDHYIATGASKNMTIRYRTNGTVWPSQDLWTRWKEFKLIDMTLSIDGIGPVFEYIRWPGRWSDFESNAKKYCALRDSGKNIVVSAHITASAYNCMSLDNIYQWCAQYQITDIFLNKVVFPQQLQLNVWPKSARKIIGNHMSASKIKDIANMGKWLLTAPDLELFEKFVKFTDQHNSFRQLDLDMCSVDIFELYKNKDVWQQQEKDIAWRRLYNDVKDPNWPECESTLSIKNLPVFIQHELKNTHNIEHVESSRLTIQIPIC
jgi:hypothetical protein